MKQAGLLWTAAYLLLVLLMSSRIMGGGLDLQQFLSFSRSRQFLFAKYNLTGVSITMAYCTQRDGISYNIYTVVVLQHLTSPTEEELASLSCRQFQMQRFYQPSKHTNCFCFCVFFFFKCPNEELLFTLLFLIHSQACTFSKITSVK